MPELHVPDRVSNFEEVELTLTEAEALKESERCLQCGLSCYSLDTAPGKAADEETAEIKAA